jgi:pimeloyl-ACP methyl ester carboxylesterase
VDLQHRDPLLIDTIASERGVILFDNVGIARTGGEVPSSIPKWAEDMFNFTHALNLSKVDVFGYSMGARVVQWLAVRQPELVRKVIIAAASPLVPSHDSPNDKRDTRYQMAMARAQTDQETRESFSAALFGETGKGQKHFEEYWQRLQLRRVEQPILQALPLDRGGTTQLHAIINSDKPENIPDEDPLASLKLPVFVANGDNDLTLGLERTLDIRRRIPNAQLVLYPNSGHGYVESS